MAERVENGEGDLEVVRDRLARTSGGFTVGGLSESIVTEKVKKALERLPQFKIERHGHSSVILKRRMNWATWGETVQLSWYPVAGGMHFDAVVRPALPTTIQDWGQGKRDLRMIHQSLLAP